MIYCLTGELIYLDALSYTAVIDCGGVGYKVTISGNTLTKLEGSEKNVRLFTHMSVREDAVELYGFYTKDELELFKTLIGVSGVGPKAGCAILTALSPEALIEAIISEDSRSISKAQGVGAKTAARIVLELHDKIAKMYGNGIVKSVTATKPKAMIRGNMADAREALIVLGYSSQDATAALQTLDPGEPVETLVRQALSILMS